MSRVIGTAKTGTTGTAKATTTTTKKFKTLTADQVKTPVTGVYKGTRTIRGKFGPQTVHLIGDKEVFGSAQLNTKLLQVKDGEIVTVKYNGMKEMENGRTFKDWEVSVND